MKKLKLWVITLLMPKRVVAMQLEKLEIKIGSQITHVGIGIHTLTDRVFASINVHYKNGVIDSYNYDDLELALKEFQFAKMVYEDQHVDKFKQMALKKAAT